MVQRLFPTHESTIRPPLFKWVDTLLGRRRNEYITKKTNRVSRNIFCMLPTEGLPWGVGSNLKRRLYVTQKNGRKNHTVKNVLQGFLK